MSAPLAAVLGTTPAGTPADISGPAPNAAATTPPAGSDAVRGAHGSPVAPAGTGGADAGVAVQNVQSVPPNGNTSSLGAAGIETNPTYSDYGLTPSYDAGAVTSDAGPLAPAQSPYGTQGSAWTPEWRTKFAALMERSGMPQVEIDKQLRDAESQVMTEQQLTTVYAQMTAALGDFDLTWRAKFQEVFTAMKVPAAEQEQTFAALAGSGFTAAKLQEALTQMQTDLAASTPGWNAEWETKFKTLNIPEDMLLQLKESGATSAQLELQFKELLDTKMAYTSDGRLKRLTDAGATPEEAWGIMLQKVSGEEFDKVVDQVKSAHVSGWRRVASVAVNLVPGVYALQFVAGKDLITGEKIDRTNPLNIVGALASGFAGFTMVRGAFQGVQGLSAANAAFRGGTASKGLTDAVTGAGLLPKFQQGLRLTDYVKAAVPIVNRFGEAGRLSAVGRGYFQSMQLASGSAALRTVAGGGVAVDRTTKGIVMGELKDGKSIADALTTAGRAPGTAGGYAIRTTDIIRDTNRFGFLQGNVSGKFGIGNGSGPFNFNPFRNGATIAETANPNVFSLGRTVNFGSTGGLAQGLGTMQAANSVRGAATTSATAARVAGVANPLITDAAAASSIGGINIADEVQRTSTFVNQAKWADRLGVTGGGTLNRVLNAGGGSSNRAVMNVSGMLEHGGQNGYRVLRNVGAFANAKVGGLVLTPLVAGATVGLTGKQMQPGWEYLKDRDEIRAAEAVARAEAETEQAEFAQLYEDTYADDAAADLAVPPTGATPPGAVIEAPPVDTTGGIQIVGTTPTGGQLVYDPKYDAVIDTATGDVYDPNTNQLIGNLSDKQAPAPAPTPTPAPVPGTTQPGDPGQVYLDPNTGYYVDPVSGYMADPATGIVYDPTTWTPVGNVNDETLNTGA